MQNNYDKLEQNNCISKLELIINKVDCNKLDISDRLDLGYLVNQNKISKNRIEC